MRSRAKILSATMRLIERGGFPAATIAAVAEEAGVSRQTVYSIFGTREDMVSQAGAELAGAWLNEVRTRIGDQPDAEGFIVELVVAGRSMVRSHPVLANVIGGEQLNPLFDAGMIDRAVLVARELLTGAVERDRRYALVLDEATELVIRVALSVVAFDSARIEKDDDLRAALAAWLVPPLTAMVDAAAASPGNPDK